LGIYSSYIHFREPQTSVWGFLFVLIFNYLERILREISFFLNFCILTPLFDTTSYFVIWFIAFLAVTLPQKRTALWDKNWNDTSVKKKNFGFGFSFSIISCIFA